MPTLPRKHPGRFLPKSPEFLFTIWMAPAIRSIFQPVDWILIGAGNLISRSNGVDHQFRYVWLSGQSLQYSHGGVDRIELVRGTGSLQYGAQFGGMLNYITKQPDTTRAITFESVNSVGSFGLLSTYNAISGKLGKFQYMAYYSKRVSNGYRENGSTEYDAQSLMLIYSPTERLKFTAELSRSIMFIRCQDR